MAQLMNVRLGRHDAQPWGFRLQGGTDFGTPLVVQKVNGGSIAEQAGLIPGDAVLKINNVDVFNLRHKDAQDVIVRSGNSFDITIQRGGSTWRPQVTPVGQVPVAGYGNSIPTVTKTSLAHKPQEVRHIGSGYNSSARPFSSVNGSDGQVKSIVNKQYNTPVGIYSEEAIAETLSAQAEVLAGGVLGVNFKKNEKVYNAANSEVYKFLHEQDDHGEPDPPAPANFFWTASHAIGGQKSPKIPAIAPSGAEEGRTATPQQQSSTLSPGGLHRPNVPFRHPQAGVEPPAPMQDDSAKSADESTVPSKPSGESSGSGVTTCDGCGVSIVGVFVRIKDKNLHTDCFKCATCGTSLKNQGYYNFKNKLYCDIHAKLAAMNNPPPGTEGYVPVPIKPCAKLSASTISAAINAHHHQSNGTSHLIGSPTSNVNQGYGGPKPFNVSPKTPPISGPKSPSTYPPPSQAPNWAQPKPAMNPYATLPRSTGPSQGRFNTYKPGPTSFNRGGAAPGAGKGAAFGATSAPKRGRGILNKAVGPGARIPLCGCCNAQVRGPFITALGRIWCPDHFVCVNANCRRPLQDIGFVEEKGDLYCEYCFEKYLAPSCSKCNAKIKGDCLNAIGKHFHPECFTCSYCGKLFGNSPFFLEEGEPYCEADWNELFTTKCFACGFPVEAGDRWVEALNHNYHSQCFNCTMCKKNLEGQSFYNKGGRPFCKNHAR